MTELCSASSSMMVVMMVIGDGDCGGGGDGGCPSQIFGFDTTRTLSVPLMPAGSHQSIHKQNCNTSTQQTPKHSNTQTPKCPNAQTPKHPNTQINPACGVEDVADRFASLFAHSWAL
jgi:hypothetical protein